MDAMRLSDQTLGNTVPTLLKKCKSQVSNSSRRPWSSAAMQIFRACPQTCSIGFRSGEHAGNSMRLYCFSFKHVLHQTRLLCGRALSSWKTKESQWLRRKGGHEVEVSCLHTFGPSKCHSNDMRVRTPAYADSTPILHPTSSSVL
ncbi:hypothetical protein TNCV_2268591 [Trichonephila clavipes]|nr:hypothetical protein TNCV_2268591 [Trichonephila clavipes]